MQKLPTCDGEKEISQETILRKLHKAVVAKTMRKIIVKIMRKSGVFDRRMKLKKKFRI
jgi:hypothetical protein